MANAGSGRMSRGAKRARVKPEPQEDDEDQERAFQYMRASLEEERSARAETPTPARHVCTAECAFSENPSTKMIVCTSSGIIHECTSRCSKQEQFCPLGTQHARWNRTRMGITDEKSDASADAFYRARDTESAEIGRENTRVAFRNEFSSVLEKLLFSDARRAVSMEYRDGVLKEMLGRFNRRATHPLPLIRITTYFLCEYSSRCIWPYRGPCVVPRKPEQIAEIIDIACEFYNLYLVNANNCDTTNVAHAIISMMAALGLVHNRQVILAKNAYLSKYAPTQRERMKLGIPQGTITTLTTVIKLAVAMRLSSQTQDNG